MDHRAYRVYEDRRRRPGAPQSTADDNSQNHDFDPLDWLHEVEADFIRQVHIVGYSIRDGVYHDRHSEPIQDNLYELLREVVSYAPVEAVILERDVDIPAVGELAAELHRLEETCERARHG
ncbi:multinuclear nonheme iron-dependent oxidase [Gimesia panareensis]|uniref:multinuclear nonheme iron-dependent oxidase n=1 Tax=Gimesia panareensis TaxID=2527978 RepID=UPI0018D7447C|nr:DUF692 family multinuclear iron-containing protein [Gimesia panareensis]